MACIPKAALAGDDVHNDSDDGDDSDGSGAGAGVPHALMMQVIALLQDAQQGGNGKSKRRCVVAGAARLHTWHATK